MYRANDKSLNCYTKTGNVFKWIYKLLKFGIVFQPKILVNRTKENWIIITSDEVEWKSKNLILLIRTKYIRVKVKVKPPCCIALTFYYAILSDALLK